MTTSTVLVWTKDTNGRHCAGGHGEGTQPYVIARESTRYQLYVNGEKYNKRTSLKDAKATAQKLEDEVREAFVGGGIEKNLNADDSSFVTKGTFEVEGELGNDSTAPTAKTPAPTQTTQPDSMTAGTAVVHSHGGSVPPTTQKPAEAEQDSDPTSTATVSQQPTTKEGKQSTTAVIGTAWEDLLNLHKYEIRQLAGFKDLPTNEINNLRFRYDNNQWQAYHRRDGGLWAKWYPTPTANQLVESRMVTPDAVVELVNREHKEYKGPVRRWAGKLWCLYKNAPVQVVPKEGVGKYAEVVTLMALLFVGLTLQLLGA